MIEAGAHISTSRNKWMQLCMFYRLISDVYLQDKICEEKKVAALSILIPNFNRVLNQEFQGESLIENDRLSFSSFKSILFEQIEKLQFYKSFFEIC